MTSNRGIILDDLDGCNARVLESARGRQKREPKKLQQEKAPKPRDGSSL